MAYVYRHIRIDTNQPFYIGVGDSDDGKYRRSRYCHVGRRNNDWYAASALGYEVEILMDYIPLDKDHEKEVEFIKLYGRADLNTGTLVNKTDGGIGCVNGISKETREKMAARLRGRAQPQWQRDILSKAAMGKDVWWCKKPVVQYTLCGEMVREFRSIADACKELKLQNANILKVINGKRKHTGGFSFKYKAV